MIGYPSTYVGTFITEWDTGTTELEWMLADDGISAAIATTMTDMALFYGFDGWLINIENKIKVRNTATTMTFIVDLYTTFNGTSTISTINIFI